MSKTLCFIPEGTFVKITCSPVLKGPKDSKDSKDSKDVKDEPRGSGL